MDRLNGEAERATSTGTAWFWNSSDDRLDPHAQPTNPRETVFPRVVVSRIRSSGLQNE